MVVHTFFTMLALGLLFLHRIKVPLFLKIVWVYFLTRALAQAYWPVIYPKYMPEAAPYYQWVNAQDALQLIIIPMLVLWWDTKRTIKYLQYICFANLAWISFMSWRHANWFTGNSMDQALDTMFLMSWNFRLGWVLNLASFLVVHGSTATLMVLAQLFAKYKKYWYCTLPTMFGGLYLVKKLFPLFFKPSNRIDIWEYTLSFWEQFGNHWFGEGIGSFSQIGPVIGSANGHHLYIWCHADWIQLLFDSGFIGLGLALILFIASAWKARKNYILFGQVLAYGVMMTFYSPLRIVLGQFILVIVLKQIWIEGEENICRTHLSKQWLKNLQQKVLNILKDLPRASRVRNMGRKNYKNTQQEVHL